MMMTEDGYPAKNMGGFPGYPMGKMPGFDMGGPMMPMPGMPRFPQAFPQGFPMPGYPMRPQYPPLIPPLPNQMNPMDPMMPKMNQNRPGGMKPFPDQKSVPMINKDKEKSTKKEESGKVLEFTAPSITAETLRSMHVSVKHVQEPLFLFTCKKILGDLEPKLKEKKLKSRAKEISEFLATLYDKIKDLEKKDKKKSTSSGHSTSEGSKISELELVNALNEVENIKTLLSLVNLEKFSLDNCYESDIIQIKESEESAALFEEARYLFSSSKGEMTQSS